MKKEFIITALFSAFILAVAVFVCINYLIN